MAVYGCMLYWQNHSVLIPHTLVSTFTIHLPETSLLWLAFMMPLTAQTGGLVSAWGAAISTFGLALWGPAKLPSKRSKGTYFDRVQLGLESVVRCDLQWKFFLQSKLLLGSLSVWCISERTGRPTGYDHFDLNLPSLICKCFSSFLQIDELCQLDLMYFCLKPIILILCMCAAFIFYSIPHPCLFVCIGVGWKSWWPKIWWWTGSLRQAGSMLMQTHWKCWGWDPSLLAVSHHWITACLWWWVSCCLQTQEGRPVCVARG